MKETIRNLNRQIRTILFICGGLFVLLDYLQKKSENGKSSRHGYQSEEFDDIW